MGTIPTDDNVFTHNLTGKPLLNLPSDSPAISAVKQILTRMGLLGSKKI
jgi:CO dehydrogenase nickel-insertion accessory protein CooC1